MSTPEVFAAVQKANIDTAVGLGHQTIENIEKLFDLNIGAVKTAIAEQASITKQALTVKTPQELYALQTALFQPIADHALTYGRSVYQILSDAQSTLGSVVEAQIAASNEKVKELVETVSANAPAGTEPAVAAVKTLINAANSAYESANKVVKQTVDIAGSNIKAAADAATKATKDAVKSTARAK